MLYWLFWLLVGLTFNVTLTALIPIVLSDVRRAQTFRGRLGYWAFFCIAAALDVGVFCWTVATFANQVSTGVTFGYLASGGEPILWPIYVTIGIATASFVTGALLLRRVKQGEARVVCRKRDAGNAFFAVQIAFLVVAASIVVAILSLLLDYVLLKFFTERFSIKLLAVCVVAELLAAAIICLILRKAVWRRKKLILTVASAVLFAILTAYYVVIALCPLQTLQSALFFIGSGLVVAGPTAFVTALIFWCSLRRRVS